MGRNTLEVAEIESREHLEEGAFQGKKVLVYGYDLANSQPRRIAVNEDGQLVVLADIDMATEGIATEATQLAIKAGLSGGTKVGITLTSANTCYLCPASTPTTDYTIQLFNGSDTDMYISPDNTASNGVLFKAGGTFVYDLKANEPLYLYCASAGKAVTAIKWSRV